MILWSFKIHKVTRKQMPRSHKYDSLPFWVQLYLDVRRQDFVWPPLRRVLGVLGAEADGHHLAVLQEGQQKQPLAQHGCKPERENASTFRRRQKKKNKQICWRLRIFKMTTGSWWVCVEVLILMEVQRFWQSEKNLCSWRLNKCRNMHSNFFKVKQTFFMKAKFVKSTSAVNCNSSKISLLVYICLQTNITIVVVVFFCHIGWCENAKKKNVSMTWFVWKTKSSSI